MKIWACAKGANGFINREDGRYKLFFIWQVLKMRRLNPAEFSALTFFSTHSRVEKRRETESLAADVSKQRDSIAEAKGLLAKDKATLVASNDGLTQIVEQLNVELGKYKTAYTSRGNEIKSLKGELENAKAGFWTKVWRAISSEKA